MPPVSVASHRSFPGRTITAGEASPEIVQAIQRQLNAAGCGPLAEDGSFTGSTTLAVKRFQMRFPDADGVPLKVDGVVGPLTWAALFGIDRTGQAMASGLAAGAIAIARQELGVREVPPGTNRGPRVDAYLRGVGVNPAAGSFPWCAAFVYFCFGEAAAAIGRSNPLARTAGVLAHWNQAERNGARRVKAADAALTPGLVKPGHIFILDFGRGVGHTGLITGMRGGKLLTIEGNTNDGGSREGIGVFERAGRTIGSINKGFIEYA
jgi:Putative peptidoglycan binding domain/CHAP domain